MITEDNLFIKQIAILEAIREHKFIKSQELKRLFLGLSERTLRYHLKRLSDAGLIKKLGSTNGVFYQALP